MLKSITDKLNAIAASVEALKQSERDTNNGIDKLNAIATTTDWLKGATVANERTLVNLDGQVKTNVSAIETLKSNQADLAIAISEMKTKLDLIHSDLIAKTNEILSKMNNLITVGKPKV